MERAARDTAAEGKAALAERCVTNPATLARVIAGLSKDAASVDVVSRHDHLAGPAFTLERSTHAILRGAR